MERLFENLGVWATSCKCQCAEAYFVMAYCHKTRFFTKNGGQQKCSDKALLTNKRKDTNCYRLLTVNN